jgi:hypothetical protein
MFVIAGIRNGWMTDFRILGWRLAKVMRKEKEQAFDFINAIVKLNIGF